MLIFIAHRHAMLQGATLFQQFRPSVRPSVRPMPILCLNKGTYRHTSDDGRGIILVTKFQGKPPQQGSLNTRVGKNAIIALYLKNDTRQAHTYYEILIKSQVADRSVSVPMTLTDLEGETQRVKLLQRICIITHQPFDREPPNSPCNICGQRHCSRGQKLPILKGKDPASPKLFEDSLLTSIRLYYGDQIRHVTCFGDGRVSGSQPCPYPKWRGIPACQKFLGASTRVNVVCETVILHGDQTILGLQDNFLHDRSLHLSWPKFLRHEG